MYKQDKQAPGKQKADWFELYRKQMMAHFGQVFIHTPINKIPTDNPLLRYFRITRKGDGSLYGVLDTCTVRRPASKNEAMEILALLNIEWSDPIKRKKPLTDKLPDRKVQANVPNPEAMRSVYAFLDKHGMVKDGKVHAKWKGNEALQRKALKLLAESLGKELRDLTKANLENYYLRGLVGIYKNSPVQMFTKLGLISEQDAEHIRARGPLRERGNPAQTR